MTRRLSLVLGILLAAGAFVGVLLLGSVFNPAPYHVVVAIGEIQPGTALEEGMVGVDAQVVSPQVAGEYVLAEELERYLGSTVVRGLVPGQPLMHRDLVAAGNPAAQRHLALVLEDPGLAALVIPAGQDNVPDGIVPGDRIAIVWSVGEASFMAGPVGGTGGPFGEPPRAEGAGAAGLPEGVELPGEVAAALGETAPRSAVSEPAPEVSLPLAKTIVNTAQVIRVRREQEANPAYTGQEGESPTVEGRVIGLEVALARQELEAVQFAVANGEYSIAVLSPNADPAELADGATLGVMWQDVLDYFQADRLRALGVLTVSVPIRPAGASSIYGPLLAPEPFAAAGEEEAPRVAEAVPESGESEGGAGAGATPPLTPTVGATAPPAPLPTATPVPSPQAQAPAAEPTSAPSGEAEGGEAGGSSAGGLPLATGNLVVGIGCVALVLLAIGAGVVLALRALRRRGRGPAA